MKKYISPEIEFNVLSAEDVLSSSATLTAEEGEQIYSARAEGLF